jgi:hypothetical protein
VEVLLIALVAALASAQEEVCPGPLSLEAVRLDLDQVEVTLRDLHGDEAADLLDDVTDSLRCVDVPVTPEDVARIGRLASLMAFFQQDSEEVDRWGQLWQTVAPNVGPGVKRSPVPELWLARVTSLPKPEIGGPAANLAPPQRGLVVVDGAAVTSPEASIGLPHFVQVFDKKAKLVVGFWQDGIVFPDEWLGGDAPPTIPAWWTASPGPTAAPAPAPTAAPAPTPAPPPAPVEEPLPTFGSEATECVWGTGDPTDVDVRHGRITIDGFAFPIRSDEDQDAFRGALRLCHEFRASRRFNRWLAVRGHLFSGDGRKAKAAFVRVLVKPEPRRSP